MIASVVTVFGLANVFDSVRLSELKRFVPRSTQLESGHQGASEPDRYLKGENRRLAQIVIRICKSSRKSTSYQRALSDLGNVRISQTSLDVRSLVISALGSKYLENKDVVLLEKACFIPLDGAESEGRELCFLKWMILVENPSFPPSIAVMRICKKLKESSLDEVIHEEILPFLNSRKSTEFNNGLLAVWKAKLVNKQGVLSKE